MKIQKRKTKEEKWAIGISHWYNRFGIILLFIKEWTVTVFLQ